MNVEDSYRFYYCARCGVAVNICPRCDYGNIYCSGECSSVRRHQSVRSAGIRYQNTKEGRRKHAVRQARYRHRQKKVTHQGPPKDTNESKALIVTGAVIVSAKKEQKSPDRKQESSDAVVYCDFCHRPCRPFARQRPLRSRKRYRKKSELHLIPIRERSNNDFP